MKNNALQAATAVSIAALLLLSGCSLLPGIPDFGGGSSGNNSSDNDSSDNDSDDNDSDNGDDAEDNPFLDHDVPDGFPSDVPLPDLDISYSLAVSEDSWGIVYKADDLEGDFGDVVDLYEGDGWDTAMNNVSEDGALGVFTKDDYTVQVLGVADGDTDFDGPGLSFTVVRTS